MGVSARPIDDLYARGRRWPNAMAQHMPAIRNLASECHNTAEIGVRRGFSTMALLAGCTGHVTSYDIDRHADHDQIRIASEGRWRPRYMPSEHAKPEPFDMMVIDGFHNYPQVKMELDLFADHVSKYLVFHDTISCGTVASGITNPKTHDAPHLSDKRGIRMAIDELMMRDRSWFIEAHYPNDSGLLVLKRMPK